MSAFQSHTLVYSLSRGSERASYRERTCTRARESERERASEGQRVKERAWALHLLRPPGYCRPRLLICFLLLLLHQMQSERARETA